MPHPVPMIERLGGEPVLRRLVDRFYDHMAVLPQAATILAMHPRDLTSSREKLFLFLVGRFGGRQTYIEQRGHPRLRMRHGPFAVDGAAADAWMACMSLALDEVIDDPGLRQELHGFLDGVARHMQNRR